MAEEITSDGYQSVRDFIESNWTFVELRDDSDSAVTRIDIDSDGRASWTHSAGAAVLEVTITVSGSDGDIPLGTTFTASVSYDVASGGNEYAKETFTDGLIATENDQLEIIHQIEVPQQA